MLVEISMMPPIEANENEAGSVETENKNKNN
jgi:hypothetical protein